jgi:hypothetical protein
MLKVFKTILTDQEKLFLLKIEEKNAQLAISKNLYYKPSLLKNKNLHDIYYLHIELYYNYLLKKLLIYNYKNYLAYYFFLANIKKLFGDIKEFVVSDYHIYKMIWNNISLVSSNSHILFNENPLVYTVSLVQILEDFLLPLPYMTLFLLDKRLTNKVRKLLKEGYDYEYILKELKKSTPPINKKKTFLFDKEIVRSSIKPFFERNNKIYRYNDLPHTVAEEPFISAKDRMIAEYATDINREKEIEDQLNILPFKFRYIPNNIFCENCLLLNNIYENPYQYIDLKNYANFLKISSISDLELKNQLYLAKYHNDTLIQLSKTNKEKFSILKSNMELKKNNFGLEEYINMHYMDIKTIEEKKILSEVSLYYEFLLKSVVEFIELFLFKFLNYIDVSKLLDIFYSGINKQEKFYEFYNLLILEFKKIKRELNVYSISFIVEFLEFIYMCTFYAGVNPNYFKYSINNIRYIYGFNNLKIFESSFWVSCKFFKVNDNKLFMKYYTTTFLYKDITNFFKYYINLFYKNDLVDLTQSNSYTTNKNLSEVDGIDFNTYISDTAEYLSVINLLYLQNKSSIALYSPINPFNFNKHDLKMLTLRYNFTQEALLRISKRYLEHPIQKIFKVGIDSIISYKSYVLTFPLFKSYNIYRIKELYLVFLIHNSILSSRNRRIVSNNLIELKKKNQLNFQSFLSNRRKYFLTLINKTKKKSLNINIFFIISGWNYKLVFDSKYLINLHENTLYYLTKELKLPNYKNLNIEIDQIPYINKGSSQIIIETTTGD